MATKISDKLSRIKRGWGASWVQRSGENNFAVHFIYPDTLDDSPSNVNDVVEDICGLDGRCLDSKVYVVSQFKDQNFNEVAGKLWRYGGSIEFEERVGVDLSSERYRATECMRLMWISFIEDQIELQDIDEIDVN